MICADFRFGMERFEKVAEREHTLTFEIPPAGSTPCVPLKMMDSIEELGPAVHTIEDSEPVERRKGGHRDLEQHAHMRGRRDGGKNRSRNSGGSPRKSLALVPVLSKNRSRYRASQNVGSVIIVQYEKKDVPTLADQFDSESFLAAIDQLYSFEE